MKRNPNHHVAIHGHFYQPPRENPWLGVIEEQESAAPFHDWNERINSECYQALTASAILDNQQKIADLFNCYAHLSFNYGPTLLAYLEKTDPQTLDQLAAADVLARKTYNGCGAAIAQVYNHPILPLADRADSNTQIIWGLREFEFRFNRPAESIWLAETAVNMATVSALIDHQVRFVILSPFQAGYFRKFGEQEWTGTPDGTIDSRLPYRVFEVDGAGRTHFDRYIDVFFYDKTLSSKVSFDHLLTNADRLEEEMRGRLAPDATLPQIALIATDGEIYGHHEKYGNRALAYFLARSLREKHLTVSNLAQYLNENPPQCEARLWEGLDGKGSSWSCRHGVARWEKNCGCGGEGSLWNQEWRTPLRTALNNLRDAIREITRRELGGLLYDLRDARNDYIEIILHNTSSSREKFLNRHAQRPLTNDEKIKLWSLLEAERYSLLMFTSCGWFFQEISGLEPVQNMRYALRAAELCAPFAKTNLVEKLENDLAAAKSNIPEQGTGRDIFRQQVLTTRYSHSTIAAAHIFAKLLNLPEPHYDTEIVLSSTKSPRSGMLTGTLTTTDRWTGESEKLFFAGQVNPAAVMLAATSAELEKIIKDKNCSALLQQNGIDISSLPYADRKRFAAALTQNEQEHACSQLQSLYAMAAAIIKRINQWRLPAPQSLKDIGEPALQQRFAELIKEIGNAKKITAEHRERSEILRNESAPLNARLNTPGSARSIAVIIEKKFAELTKNFTAANIDELFNLLKFAQGAELPPLTWDHLRGLFWHFLNGKKRRASNESAVFAGLLQISDELGFLTTTVRPKIEQLLSE